ncbi:MAG: biopolymer transporter ExbD [Phycisphaerales bacterium]|jgi:biopolymer transport protein ExbD|nr:biopolymer transporter ExbD [Phycisphaerales bacterium]
MYFRKTKTRDHSVIVEMTPMIDIVFLLIIFFMVAAQFAQQARLGLDLPKETGEQSSANQDAGLVINIRKDGALILETDSPPISFEALETRIREVVSSEGPSWQKLLIRADRSASTTVLNEVLQLLNRHGLSATRIATEVP